MPTIWLRTGSAWTGSWIGLSSCSRSADRKRHPSSTASCGGSVAARLERRYWTALLVRDLGQHLDAVLEQLQRAGRDHGGLLLTSSAEVPFRVPLPSGYRWLPLRQLLDADEGVLGIREGAIRRALAGGPGRSLVERPPGRPGVKQSRPRRVPSPQPAREVEPTVRAEAGVLLSWLLASHPDSGRPIPRHHREHHPIRSRGVARANPRPTK